MDLSGLCAVHEIRFVEEQVAVIPVAWNALQSLGLGDAVDCPRSQ